MAEIVSGTVTSAGARYIARKVAALEDVVISHFVLSYVPGASEVTTANPSAGLPPASQQVATIEIDNKPRYNNDNAVTYSLVLGSGVGDFDFNRYDAVTDTGIVLAYQYLPVNRKRKNIGQVINRNLVVSFANAKQMTGADLPVESWQFDWEPEMAALQLTQITNSVAQMSMINTAMATHERLLRLEGKL